MEQERTCRLLGDDEEIVFHIHVLLCRLARGVLYDFLSEVVGDFVDRQMGESLHHNLLVERERCNHAQVELLHEIERQSLV